MKINVKLIPVEGKRFEGTEPPSIMELDEPDVHFEQEVRYALQAEVHGNALLVTGAIRAPATLRCSRCLRQFVHTLEVNDFLFHYELRGEDFVDLTASIREDTILQLPQRALCSESCKGLCPTCGKDQNEAPCQCVAPQGDPHWHALDGLKLR